MGNQHTENDYQEIFEALNFYRGLILDLTEQALGHHENWSYFRGRLLGLLGLKGLEGRLRVILQSDTGLLCLQQSLRPERRS